MKHLNWLVVGLVILCLAMVPLAGCVAKSEYRDFSSLRELQDWLLANDVSERPPTQYADAWYSKALEIQEDALKDGYIVSADYDAMEEGVVVWCTTVINGKVFYWDPETDEVFEEYYLGTVK